MMISRGLFGWSPPHIQPLTPVSEVSEPPESPSPYMDASAEAGTAAGQAVEVEEEPDEMEEMEPPPAAVPFSRLFACADRLDWLLMLLGSLAAAAHGAALVVYLHYFAKIIHVLSIGSTPDQDHQKLLQVNLTHLISSHFVHSTVHPEAYNFLTLIFLFIYFINKINAVTVLLPSRSSGIGDSCYFFIFIFYAFIVVCCSCLSYFRRWLES